MEAFVDVAAVQDLPEGRAKRVVVGSRSVALYHTSHGFFATENTCPHRGGPLSDGDLVGDEIICPWHLWGFDVVSGVCTGNSEIAVVTHEVRVDHDRILVRLSPASPMGTEPL